MTEQEKELLLKDLCSRLPYHVRVKVWLEDWDTEEGPLDLQHNYGDVLLDAFYYNKIAKIKPYLRPMSSMTEEEASDMLNTMFPNFRILRLEIDRIENGSITFAKTDAENNFGHMTLFFNRIYSLEQTDWLNARHFDYRGLIGKGLALEAPEGTY